MMTRSVQKRRPASTARCRSLSLLALSLLACGVLFAACAQSPGTGGATPGSTPTSAPINTPAPQTPVSTPTPRPSTPENATPLKQVRMLDAQNGWALTKSAILRTYDGGRTWRDVSLRGEGGAGQMQGGGENAVSTFLNGQVGWVIIPLQVGSADLHLDVWRTQDGGETWKDATFVATNIIGIADRPRFIDAQHGWLLLDGSSAAGSMGAKLYQTIDAGQSWTLVSQAPGAIPLLGIKRGPTFTDTLHGWLSDSVGALSDSPLLYSTSDGGKTWQQHKLPPVKSLSPSFYEMSPPVFFTTQSGVETARISGEGGGSGLATFVTQNGGQSWTVQADVNLINEKVYTIDTTHSWALSSDGWVGYTADAGKTWNKIATLPNTVDQMSFINPQAGWINDTSATKLYHTTDGGQHWQTISYTAYILG